MLELPLAAAVNPENGPFVLSAVLLNLVVIYFASKLGGEIAIRFGFPPVLGELVGGVLVGVSALHLLVTPEFDPTGNTSAVMQFLRLTDGLSPEAIDDVFTSSSEVIETLSEIGVVVLLFEVGLESNLRELVKVGLLATVVAVVGVGLPFALGTIGAVVLFHLPVMQAIFAGAALTATSIGITSKVLSELGQLNSKEGQIILGAAIIDDILGIIVLAVVSSLAKTGEVDVSNLIYLILGSSGFLLGAILLANFFNGAYTRASQAIKTRGNVIVPAFVFAFAMAYIASAIHLEAILGSFAAGIVLDGTDVKNELDDQIKPIADLLVPTFFISVGAKTDLSVLNPSIPANREGLIIALFLITVAILGKVATGLAVWGNGLNRLAIGVGMIPRGEVGLVFAGIGTASGILSESLNAAIIMMVIITTFLAPPLLRLVFPKPATAEVVAE
ncbi:MAG: cation:proton antiporter [Pseudanabaenaceae cyanobacterium]